MTISEKGFDVRAPRRTRRGVPDRDIYCATPIFCCAPLPYPDDRLLAPGAYTVVFCSWLPLPTALPISCVAQL